MSSALQQPPSRGSSRSQGIRSRHAALFSPVTDAVSLAAHCRVRRSAISLIRRDFSNAPTPTTSPVSFPPDNSSSIAIGLALGTVAAVLLLALFTTLVRQRCTRRDKPDEPTITMPTTRRMPEPLKLAPRSQSDKKLELDIASPTGLPTPTYSDVELNSLSDLIQHH